MQFKNLSLAGGAALAPMAGFTDAPCRRLMAEHGAIFTVSEMVSAKALTYGDKKSRELVRITDPGTAYGIQLFGAEAETMGRGAAILREEGFKFDFIDINMGCPAPKIVGGGAGSSLMLDPAKCGAIVAAVVEAAGPYPVTVKMRAGWDADHITAVEVARQCEANGAAALAVHGRTRKQMYEPGVDRSIIRRVKEAVAIPVLGNGDILTAKDALSMREETGCDSVLVGRGALGNPWLFDQIAAAWNGQPLPPPPSLNARLQTMRRQIYQMCEEKGERVAMAQARGQAIYYLRGLRGAASLRRACGMLTHFEDVDQLIETVFRVQKSCD